ALAGEGGPERGERLGHAGILGVGADARRGPGLALGLLAQVPDLVVDFVDSQRLDSRHAQLPSPISRGATAPPGCPERLGVWGPFLGPHGVNHAGNHAAARVSPNSRAILREDSPAS